MLISARPLGHRSEGTNSSAAELISITPHTEFKIVEMARVSSPPPFLTGTLLAGDQQQREQERIHLNLSIDSPLHSSGIASTKLITATREGSPDVGSSASGQSKRLIKYLIDHQHWSPFEMASMTVKITTTRDISRQILRHRSFSFQEFSQRYQDIKVLNEQPTFREARLQDTKNRQNSLVCESKELQDLWHDHQQTVWNVCMNAYNNALRLGIAKEQARALLPIGLTMSRLYMTGDIRSWLHYLAVRLDPTTQKEHRQLAALIKDEVGKYFDLSAIFGDDNGQT